MLSSFRLWLRERYHDRQLSKKAEQRRLDQLAKKIQLEVDPLERRWVPNDVFGLIRTVLPGLALGLAGQKALGKFLEEPKPHSASHAEPRPLSEQIAALALSLPRHTPKAEPAAESAPRKERPAQTPAERGEDWPAFAKSLFDDLNGRDKHTPASAGDALNHGSRGGAGGGSGSSPSRAPDGGSRGARQGGKNTSPDVIVPPPSGQGGRPRNGKPKPGGDTTQPDRPGPVTPGGVTLLGGEANPQGGEVTLPAQLDAQFAAQPLAFEANEGQAPAEVKYLTRAKGYTAYLTGAEAVVVLAPTPQAREENRDNPAQDVLRLQFPGASATARVESLDPLRSRSNYFLGSDRSEWHGDVAQFGQVAYRGLFPGVDLTYRGGDGQRLRFDFTVAPGADAGDIRFRFGGVSGVSLNQRGELVLTTAHGQVTQRAPVLYQDINGSRVTRTGRYVLSDGGEVGFHVDSYDPTRPLVIDPTLDYGSYLGGSGTDEAKGVAVDLQGNVYTVGSTTSANFPLGGPLQSTLRGSKDVFITKLSASGSVVYSSYLGSTSVFVEEGYAIAVDAAGNAYITGGTSAADFPVTAGAYNTSGVYDAFVSKISAAGNALVWSTYLGGSSSTMPNEAGRAIAVDASGAVFVAGTTKESTFPTTAGAFDTSFNGTGFLPAADAFLTRLKPDGSGLLYSTFLGGLGEDVPYGLAVTPSGVAVIAGATNSTNYPTASPYQGANQGGTDAFVTALNAAGSGLVHSSYLGGAGTDEARAVAVNGSGEAFVAGLTQSSAFPTTSGAHDTALGGSQDAFVTKFAAGGGGTLGYSTFLGGAAGNDAAYGVGLDAQGNAHVGGVTAANNFPTASATQTGMGGGASDAFVSRLNSGGTSLVFSTFLGGSGDDQANAAAVDLECRTVAVGSTTSTNFPVPGSPVQGSSGGGGTDAFLARYGGSPDAPAITGITDDDGVAGDFITRDQTLMISGTADPLATVTLYRAGVGALPTPVQADGSGLWSYTYSTTLAEGTHAFRARATLSGKKSTFSTDKLVTVDLSGPTVTLTADASTYDLTPRVLVTSFDLGGQASNATVTLDVDLNNDNDFGDANETGYQATTLSNGYARFEVSALAVGTVKMRARVTDLAGNEGTSNTRTVQVQSLTTWGTVGSGSVSVTDPFNGDPLSHQGALQLGHGLDLDKSPGNGQSGGAALVYDSRRVSVKPVAQGTVRAPNNAALPATITAALTWNGTVVATNVYSTTGRSGGDDLTVAVQVPTAVTTVGRYAWTLNVTYTGGSQSFSGVTYLAPEDTSPYGAGWNLSQIDRLYTIANDAHGNKGVLRVFGAGGWAFHEGDYSSGSVVTFTNSAGDNGTLVKDAGGAFSYTVPSGERQDFNSSGLQIDLMCPCGCYPLTSFTYTDGDGDGQADDLLSQTNLDGSLITFTYASNKLRTIDAPGPRTVTLTHSSGDLTQVTNPDDGLHTFTYEASTHRATGETFGTMRNSWAFSNGMLATITAGTTSSTTLTPAVAQGLSSIAAGTPEAVLTDPLSRKSYLSLDGSGRTTSSLSGAGAVIAATRDGEGRVTVATDTLGRAVTYTRDGAGYVTKVKYADGNEQNFQYQSAYHALISTTDERGYMTKFGYDASGHLVTVTNALNQVTTYAYNADGTLQKVTDALNHTTSYLYDSSRRVETVIDALGNRVTTTYDSNGNVATTVDQLNRTTTYLNDKMGRTTQTTDALNGLWTTTYNAAGQTLQTKDALGHTASPVYDDRGLVTKSLAAVGTGLEQSGLSEYNAAGERTGSRDANGVWSSSGVDIASRSKTTTDALGGTRKQWTDLAGQVVATRDELGRLSQSAYNERGWLVRSVNVLGEITTYGYDAAGNQTSVTDALNHTHTTVYDELGREVVSVTPLGFRTTTSYDAVGNVVTLTDARGTNTRYEYDELNRRVQTIEAYGTGLQRTLTSAYDAVGNLTASIDGLGRADTFTYDSLNRQVTAKDPLGHVGTTAYNAVGNATSATDPLNKTTTYGYDALNRQVSTTDPLSHTGTMIMDARGQQVAGVDGLGQAPQTGHDVLGRPAAEIDETWGLTRRQYDAAGNLISLTDPVGNETQWAYDALNREVQMTDPNGESVTMTYDAAGRLSSRTDRLGRRKDSTYDEDNRLTNEVWVSSGGSTVNRATFTYDEAGHNLTAKDTAGTLTFTYDEVGRTATQKDVWGTTLTFTYDAGDRRTEVKDSFAGVLTSVYDNSDRLTSRKFGGAGQTPLRIDLDYNLRNEVTTITRYSDLAGSTVVGTSVYTIDDASRLTRIDHKNGSGTALASYVYSYDNANRVTDETINGGLRTFSYDRTDQMTNDGGTAYSYDANGNRTMSGYQTGVANRLSNDGTWTYTYDDEGNVTKKSKGASAETWEYIWDHDNHLVGAEKRATDGGTLQVKTTFTYDVVGNLVQDETWKTGGGTTTTRMAVADGQVWARLDGSNALQLRHLYLDGTDQLFGRIDSGGTAAWYLTDHLGSVRQIISSAGATQKALGYDAWGRRTTDSAPSYQEPFGYTGREWFFEILLQYNRGRWYDVDTGRWMSEDPLGFGAGDVHLARYVGNNPTNATDPSGLEEQIVLKPGHIPGVVVRVRQTMGVVGYRYIPVPYIDRCAQFRVGEIRVGDIWGVVNEEPLDPNPKDASEVRRGDVIRTDTLMRTYLIAPERDAPGLGSEVLNLLKLIPVVRQYVLEMPQPPALPKFHYTGEQLAQVDEANAPYTAEWLRVTEEIARKGGFKNYQDDIQKALNRFEAMCKALGWNTKLP